jgi:hypothetical protein
MIHIQKGSVEFWEFAHMKRINSLSQGQCDTLRFIEGCTKTLFVLL